MQSPAAVACLVAFFFVFAPAAAGAPPDDPARVVGKCGMDRVRDACRRWLVEALGMRITLPIRFSWDTAERIKLAAGPNAAGYTCFVVDGPNVTATVHAPCDQRLDHTVHVLTHELTHVWEYEQGIRNDRELTEGVSEWAAWHHLEALGYAAEQRVVEGNVLDGYASGFSRVEKLSRQYGVVTTVELLVRLARAGRASAARLDGMAASATR